MNKNFSSVFSVLIVAILIGVGVYFIFLKNRNAQNEVPSQTNKKSDIVNYVNSKPADDEITFTTPVGYTAIITTQLPEERGIDREISLTKNEYLEHPSSSGEGPRSIHVYFYRNPKSLPISQFLKENEIFGYQNGIEKKYKLSNKDGIRFPHPGGMFLEDHIVVQHKNWIVVFSNFSDSDTDPQNKVYSDLLSTVRFAK